MDPLLLLPAIELARRLRAREFSAVELLQAQLARVERLDKAINAVVVRCPEAALARAREADRALARGRLWGPLHGVPITVKEAFDVEGTPTTWGLAEHKGNIAPRHATAVQRLVDAGAVVLGKTNVPVALADWQSFNPVYGTTRNPWDPSRSPGGSSGGSAAALAAGLSALELGSDIGSSIRNPAHYCGVWGHKPTWGVVPIEGHQLPGEAGADSTDIGAVGPMARDAHDLTLAMDLLSRPLTAYGPMGRTPALWRDDGRPVRALRIAVMADAERARVDAPVRQAVETLADFLRHQGLTVDETARPLDPEEAWRTYLPLLRGALVGHMSDADFADAQAQAALPSEQPFEFPAVHWRSMTQSHRDWLRHDERRARQRLQWAAFFERFDLMILPIAATTAMRHDQTGYRWNRMIPVDGRLQPQTAQLFWAGYAGAYGLPATAVPIGQGPDGLPIGAQLVGPAFGDPVCLRLARWLQAEYRGFVPPPMALA